MVKNTHKSDKPIIFQAKSGAIELRGDVKRETLWASQADIASVFSVERSVVTKHVNKIFKDGEIDQKSNVQKMHIANSDKPVTFYNLDIVLAVGYRTNSRRAIEFRRWATKTLRQYINDGYVINKTQIAQNYERFLGAIRDIKQITPSYIQFDTDSILELISAYAETWLSLDAYDKDRFVKEGVTKKSVELTAEQLVTALAELRQTLLKKNEATELFGAENRRDAIQGIVGNVMQTFDGEFVYPTIEEKAAHLLYFIVKNHPFVDGNKRSGAFAFVWFLSHAGIFNPAKMNTNALTALTLLVAESDPHNKERIIGLVLQLLK